MNLKKVTKEEATETILLAKKDKGLSFDEIAVSINRHPVWTATAIMGQASMDQEEADKLVDILGLDPSISSSLQEIPHKGSLDETIPVDPLIYRFYEVMQVYGTSMKAVIHEKFGDGIMSAIDFTMDIQKKEDPAGDRVVVTFDGKFLPYKKW
ncbi:cyanase [Virgibacillus sp. W0181]|uniref:cyanase n=1 Tax=Virgibacillus sp. W0181 TaxID=3391581 RepID=UPI003F48B287